jgi:exodeoxyribonuclease VII large subunit
LTKAYSLFELNEYIRRVLALNLPEAIWVEAEIAQVNHSRGHYFLTLIQKEKEGETLVAQSEAVIWERALRKIQRANGKQTFEVLQAGLAVKLQVRVDFNERYGLKLIVEDLDPAFTLGALEIQKRAALERLQKEGLLTLNRQTTPPPVLQRIAVLSSPEAAGFQDFVAQLEKNAFGYAFQWQLFPIAVQGPQVLPELKRQFKKINRWHSAYDCVVLIRGGGGRTDLAAFDQYELGAELARCPLPVLTGIGHEIDETIADLVAYRALKTPTAVAEYLIGRSLEFEGRLHDLARQIQNLGLLQLRHAQMDVQRMEQNLFFLCRQRHERAQNQLDVLRERMPLLLRRQFEKQDQQFEKLRSAIELLQPESLLRRGYSLTYRNGRLIRSVEEIQPGDEVRTQLSDGQFRSTISRKEKE